MIPLTNKLKGIYWKTGILPYEPWNSLLSCNRSCLHLTKSKRTKSVTVLNYSKGDCEQMIAYNYGKR